MESFDYERERRSDFYKEMHKETPHESHSFENLIIVGVAFIYLYLILSLIDCILY